MPLDQAVCTDCGGSGFFVEKIGNLTLPRGYCAQCNGWGHIYRMVNRPDQVRGGETKKKKQFTL